MILTPDNYHSSEANLHYMSVSQYKHWLECEATTLAHLRGEVEEEDKEAFLVGSYVHSFFESPEAFRKFQDDYSHIILNKKGEKYAAYKKADEMIETLRNDPKVMFYLQGQKEVIMTADLFGVPWKIKMDVYNPSMEYILDLKTAQDIGKAYWRYDPDEGRNKKQSFVEEYQYMIQAAVYAEVERIASGRDVFQWIDPIMIAVTKQDPPDHCLISLRDDERFAVELNKIRENLPRILAVKSGVEKPQRCGVCKYCRSTKRVDKPIHYSQLQEVI